MINSPNDQICRINGDDIVRGAAKTIRQHSRSSTKSIIVIGNALLLAKAHLKHGQFTSWVERQCGFTMRTAQNYIRASEFAAFNGEVVALLTPAALYRLAANSTPFEVVSHVISMIGRGNIPTECEIEAMIMLCRLSDKERDLLETPTTPSDLAAQLASDLRLRIGDDMAHKLADGPWNLVGKCLRLQLRHNGAPKPVADCGLVSEPMRAQLIPFQPNRPRITDASMDRPQSDDN